MTTLIHGMLGLGDNVYQRAALREVSDDVYLVTAWPELYADLPSIRCVQPVTRLRTQAKNAARPHRWHEAPEGLGAQIVSYAGKPGTIIDALFESAGLADPWHVTFDLPSQRRTTTREPYVVVRPVTIRREWPAEARNPYPRYIVEATEAARAAGLRIVVIADIDGVDENAVGVIPEGDESYLHGELTIDQLLPLIANAAGLIGGVGWMVPAAIAYRRPMLTIFGGWGRDNGPRRIYDRRLDLSRMVSALPTRFCMCGRRNHACDKAIDNFGDHVDRFLRFAAPSATAVAA